MAAILSFLAILTPYLPVMLEIAGWMLQTFGASKANLEQYQSMIQANKDAGLITVETANRLADFHSQLKAGYDKTASKPS